MSNYGLKSQVNELESQLRDIERENSQLRSEINSTISSVNQAERTLSDYNQQIRNTLDYARGTIDHSINRALDAYELQGQIDQLYSQYKCVELANKKIRALNNKKYYDFNNYRTVRKVVQGMMDNLDIHMISDATIYKSIERQHLLTPDFWLTSALISIMAWKNDDKMLADRAIQSAFKLDKKNSSIFYMIFNLRMERDEAAVKWFLEYQKCNLKGSDENTFLMMFSLISKTLTDRVDQETVIMIRDFIHRLILDSAKKEGYSEEDIIQFLQDKMLALMKTESYEFPVLAQYCKDYGNMARMLNLAGNNYNILEFILKIVNVPVAEKNTYMKEYLNELLNKPNAVEIETYNEIEYNELVIKLGGDVDTAKAMFEQELSRRESELNIVSSMIGWIYDFSNEDVNGQMRLNMFTLVRTFQEKAAEAYWESYRAMDREFHPVQILDYAVNMNFKDETGEIVKVEQFYEEQKNQELAAVKNMPAYVVLGLGVVCGVAAFFVHLILLAGLGIGLCAGVGILVGNRFKKKNIVLKVQKQKEVVAESVRKLFGEYGRFKEVYEEFDGVAERIGEEFAKL